MKGNYGMRVFRGLKLSLWWRRMAEKSSVFFTERGFDIMGSVCTDFTGVEAMKKWKSMLAAMPRLHVYDMEF